MCICSLCLRDNRHRAGLFWTFFRLRPRYWKLQSIIKHDSDFTTCRSRTRNSWSSRPESAVTGVREWLLFASVGEDMTHRSAKKTSNDAVRYVLGLGYLCGLALLSQFGGDRPASQAGQRTQAVLINKSGQCRNSDNPVVTQPLTPTPRNAR